MVLKTALTNIFYISKLSLQLLSLMTKAKYKRRKAKNTFQKTLISYGIPPEAARELAKAYSNPISEILSLINVRKMRDRNSVN